MNDPLGRSGRWARAVCALAGLALAIINLSSATVFVSHPHTAPSGVGSAVAALVGAHYLLLTAGVCLAVTVPALRRGKRAAWWAAVAGAVASLTAEHVRSGQWPRLLAPAGVLLLLLACRAAFVTRSDPVLLRRGLAVLCIGEAAVFAYAVLGLWRMDPDFTRTMTIGPAVRAALGLLFLLPVGVEPITRHGQWFVESVRTGALSVAVLGLCWLVAGVVGRPGHLRDRRRVRELLSRYATTGVAHFHLLDDKSWMITADGRAFVGYKVVGATAVALGEPIGHPGSIRAAADEFARLCALNGWDPVFYQVTEQGRADLVAAGWKTLRIGEEAIIDLAAFDLARPECKAVRSAVRRCERAGYRVVELAHPVHGARLAELREVSDVWLAAGNHRERTFTLGRFDPAYLRTTPIVAVLDARSRVQAFVNLLPSYQSCDATFDLMRRRPDAVNGVIDQLFVALIERFSADGYTGLNLGLAPLTGAGQSRSDRIIRLLYAHAGAVFNFSGLRAFKDKWHPRWEPRYLAYRFDTRLLGSAAAVARAGELPDPRSPLGRLTALLRRFPVTVAFFLLQAWIMTATAAGPVLHAQLIRHFGLAWPDLVHGQFWRLVSAPLIQTGPGWVWSNIMLIIAFVPAAEWRLGSRRALITFFCGDLAATVSVLLTLRLTAAAGSTAAAQAILARDAGSSAGCWALAAALAWSLPGQARTVAVTAVLVVLGAETVAHQRLFDFQHLAAAVFTVLAYAAAARWGARWRG
ncbi:phosphatidylglycerol lysyltransferase domain-containing protein [Dactylosporangium sp. NPDC049525]|uniref:phosphatidylglycerol lysyltransferase domain-containing protein n=1 Tax=Dactylosporangium sp. NPDC049525 TaxID=3154730 RepID=UPI0034205643